MGRFTTPTAVCDASQHRDGACRGGIHHGVARASQSGRCWCSIPARLHVRQRRGRTGARRWSGASVPPRGGQGHADAQYILGAMYRRGEGVERDHIEAYAWYNLAVAQGHKSAEQDRGKLRQEMDTKQISEAQELSVRLFTRIRERGPRRLVRKTISLGEFCSRIKPTIPALGRVSP